MKLRAALLLISLRGVAVAQPVTTPAQVECVVHVVEAPATVRAEIERWVAAEPRCSRSLEVRVDATPRGFHLVATDGTGRVRERGIPDAESAAVLVVSWMADDSTTEPEVTVSIPAPTAAAVIPLRGGIAEPDFAVSAQAISLRPRHDHQLALGVAMTDDDVGFHGQVDAISRGALRFGVAGGWRGRAGRHEHMDRTGSADAAVFAAATHTVGRVELRAQVGVGAELTTAEMSMVLAPKLDASLLIGVPLRDRWGLTAGPMLVVPLDGRDPTLLGFAGLERRF